MSAFLDALPERYSVILCDLWGVVHDGYSVFPGVVERLGRWKSEGRSIVFLTNAPRTGAFVRRQLDGVGLPRGLESGIISAGEAAANRLEGRPVGFCGTADDREDLEGHGLNIVEDGFDQLACAGLQPGETVADYDTRLRKWRSADVLMHCLNPDRVVIHKGERMICAGALADAYEALGGRVCWYGKPFPAVYEEALAVAGSPAKDQVLAIGDGLQTDAVGAAKFGIDLLFVTAGVHGGEPFPHDFASQHGLGNWSPVAVVPRL